jgi:diguanylate cyclase (GGDEF)-like protein
MAPKEKFKVGDIIDKKYCLIEHLGSGGMGIVFLAQHMLLQKKVALKCLQLSLADGDEAVKRFFREAKAAAAVSHRGVAEVYDIGWLDDSRPYIVMEYVEGESLETYLRRSGGKLSIELAVEIAIQILSVLISVHAKQIVHRDLKPENIFVCADEDGHVTVKVLDFGVSKVLTPTESSRLTKAGQIVGSLRYMSPEQVQGEPESDHRMDLWSVGVLLYQLLTGATPFLAKNVDELIYEIVRQPVRPPTAARSEIPAALEAIVLKALSRSPDGRHADAAQFRGDLISFLNRHMRNDQNSPLRTVATQQVVSIEPRPGSNVFTETQDAAGEEIGPVHCFNIVHGLGSERLFQMTQDECIVGRDGGCDLVLMDEDVSRRHARIFKRGAALVIQDLESCNGVYVNGTKSLEAELRDGDRVLLGYTSLLKYNVLTNDEARSRGALRESCTYDQLTGALSRRSLDEQLASEWAFCARRENVVSVVVLVVNHIDEINKTFGFQGGDAVLRDVSRVVLSSIRGGDIFARYAGEQFVLMLKGVSEESALRFAHRVGMTIGEQNLSILGVPIEIEVSIGRRLGQALGRGRAQAPDRDRDRSTPGRPAFRHALPTRAGRARQGRAVPNVSADRRFSRTATARYHLSVRAGFVASIVVAVSLLQGGAAHAEPEEPGPLAISTWDAGRVDVAGTSLATKVFYPTEGGPYPVVGVIHGASRNGSYMRVMAETIASRGFVAVVPTIPCNVYDCDHDANAAQLAALLDWAVAESSRAGSALEGLVDGERRGLVGHSWGGLASHLAAARDDRIDALVLLDPNDDLGVGAAEAGAIVAPTLQVLAERTGVCNSMWDEGVVTPALTVPKLQVTISSSGHCDPEDPSDALCPIACGSGDRATTPLFRRYAVAWISCVLGGDTSVAPWAGGASFEDDVAAELLRDVVIDGVDDLPCRSAAPPDGDADADSDGDTDADGDADSDSDLDADADADADADSDADADADVTGDASSGEGAEGCGCRAAGGRWPDAGVMLMVAIAAVLLSRGDPGGARTRNLRRERPGS